MMTMQFCPKVMVEMLMRCVRREILSDNYVSCFSRLSAVPYLCMYAHVCMEERIIILRQKRGISSSSSSK